MNPTYFLFLLYIILCTLIITYWAAKRSGTTNRFFVAAGSLTGFQNGLAIAGDFISAASFLGIVGMVAFNGYDGFLYCIGFLVSYLVVLYLVAEPVHRLGKYSLGDVIASRFPNRKLRTILAICTCSISLFYIIPQVVASGYLLRLLINIDFSVSVIVVGGLMTIYVAFGGMIATSWVQIVKTVLLMSGVLLLTLIVFSYFNWDMSLFLNEVRKGSPYEEHFFHPGNLYDNPIEFISLQLALVLGTAGLPHILIRFFTVSSPFEVRRSLITASWIIGLFYIMTLILGFGAVGLLGYDALMSADSSGNLAAPLLAQVVGGDFLLAYISAIAFTTIIAVVAGLVISATTAFSHDIYHHIMRRGRATENEQLKVARWSALFIGIISTLISLRLESINVTLLVSITFLITASSIFPVLLLIIYWRRMTAVGAITGMICGFIAAIVFVLLGPISMNVEDGWFRRESIFPFYNPGIITVPIGFIGAYIGSLLSSQDAQCTEEFESFYIKSQTGISRGE